MQPVPDTPDPAQDDPAFADLCQVQRSADQVQMSFGRRVPSALLDGAEGVQLQHQVSLAAAGAAHLQDLLLALLQAGAAPLPPGTDR